MKKFIYIIALIFCHFLVQGQVTNSTEVGVTEGQLSVSLTGAATYSIPIKVPPGINGIVPQISLTYNSQSGNGLAGYGWNISGISVITRIPSTKFHDGVIDPVDFDALDRFALDGQRLVVKNGTSGVYGADGTQYETENYSNLKITSIGVHPNGANYGPASFKVEYPDGSVAVYGNTAQSRTVMNWGITEWRNPQQVKIFYFYENFGNNMSIGAILYGSENSEDAINKIIFNYSGRTRSEQAYVGGLSINQTTLINEIKISGYGVPYRNYFLGYDATSLGYQRLKYITEKTGDGTLSLNSTVFDYDTTSDTDYLDLHSAAGLNGFSAVNFTNTNSVTGDFDGDSKLDFVLYPITGTNSNRKFTLFKDVTSGVTNYGFEQNTGEFKNIFASTWLTADNKVAPKQGITIAKLGSGSVTYQTYVYRSTGLYLEDTKNIILPTFQRKNGCRQNTGIDCVQAFEPFSVNTSNLKNYFGDFNGDGITDVIAIFDTSQVDIECSTCHPWNNPNCPPGSCYEQLPSTLNASRSIFIDLKRNAAPSSFNPGSGVTINANTRIEVADFNGDGKSDIYCINIGYVTIHSLDNDNILRVMYSFSDSGIKTDRPILFGDYNGDGKMDICIPQAVDSYIWNFYLSTGIGFNLKSTNIGTKYMLGGSGWTSEGIDITEFSYFASDFNGDGKADILKQLNHTRYCCGSISNGCDDSCDGQPHETEFVLCQNKGFNTTGSLVFSTTLVELQTTGVYRYPLPIITNHNNPNLNMEYGLISNNKLITFNSVKDNKIDVLLKSITTGNSVMETITYKPLKNEVCGDNCNSVYTDSGNTEAYPNMDIVLAPTFKVVTQIDKQSSTVHKKQQFMYYGAVTNFEGLGFLGFRATMSTNWTDIAGTNLITTINKNDIALRGANKLSYSVLGFDLPQNLTPTSNFISKTINTYNIDNTTGAYEDPMQTNKVFKLKNTKTEQFNGLEGTNSITTTLYDSFNNPKQSTTVLKNGTTTEQTTVTDIGYVSATSSPTYVVGRPSSKTTTITTPQDAQPSINEETYDYQNHLLTEINKRSTNSGQASLYITEKNEYDDFGNIIKKTIAYPGLQDRVTRYEYDPQTHRFLTKSTDIEGLVTEYSYDQSSGVLLSEKLPSSVNALITTYDYDKWFKKIKVTDYLNKKVDIAYTRQAEKTLITSTGEDDSESTELLDDLGRKIKTSIKNIDGSVSNQDFEYDLYNRNTRASEPYFANQGVSQWNTTTYDEYGRIKQVKLFTDKTINTTYNGLSSTVEESTVSGTPAVTNTKTKVSVKNAIGQVVSLTESNSSGPLGTINYTYFANGNLATTSFDGNTTTILQNEWGRKKSLNDTSAGLYQYSYNGFGEILTESSLNGTTTYNRDDYGKVLTKTISGNLTNSKTTYSYNADKLLSHTLFEDFESGTTGPVTTSYVYEYDDYKRLKKTTETSPQATFEHEITDFDDFGNPQNEYYKATNLSDGKFSENRIKNTYLKGYHWQILEGGTNNLLWETDAVNARGQLVMAQYGTTQSGGALGKEMHSYDNYGLPLSTQYFNINGANASATNPIVSLSTRFEAQTGNLTNRNYSFYGAQEDFLYDSSDRLIVYPDPLGSVTGTRSGGNSIQTYDNKGRITANNLGEYKYDTTKPYQQNGLKIYDPTVTSYFNERTPQIIAYNAIKKPVTIQEYNIERITFKYNDGNSRSVMYYGDYNPDKNLRKFRKFYSADGSMEIKRNLANNTVEFITYLGGDGYSAPVLSRGDGNSQNYLYLHRDYQGTIVGVSDGTGQLIEQRHFDAWGSLIKYWNNTGLTSIPTTAGIMLLDRGYTGHEHLLGVGIINMNGRMYDPKLHRFLSPDNYVQDPSNTQSFNRYGYCWNNPLKYADYNGEYFGLDDLGAALLGGLINWGVNGFQFNASGLTAFSAGAAAGWLSLYPEFGGWIAAGAILGSTNAYLNKTDVIEGAFMGVFSSAIGGAVGQWAASGIGGVVVNGIKVTSPLLQGTIIGSIAGAVAGSVTGFSMALIQGASFDDALDSAKIGFEYGFVTGSITGAVGAIKAARKNGVNPITGKSSTPTIQSQVSNYANDNQIYSGQKNLGDSSITDQYLKQMEDGTFDTKNGAAGFKYNGKTILTEGNHRMNAAIQYQIKTGSDFYVKALIINGNFTNANPSNYGYKTYQFPVYK